MKLYYFQGSPIAAPFSIESNQPFFDHETVNLKIDRLARDAQRWELSFNLMDRGAFEADYLIHKATTFGVAQTMIMPQLNHVMNRINDTFPAIGLSRSVTDAAGSSTITVTAVAGNNTLVLPKGSFIKLSNHNKIYMVTQDKLASGTSISIYPKLTTALLTTTTVQTGNSVLFRYFHDLSNLNGSTYEDGLLTNVGTIRLLEAL